MKYRHQFHAGNFADIHKHVTLVALLGALTRKDKGFLYLETHAGRGRYDLRDSAASRTVLESIERVLQGAAAPDAPEEIKQYAQVITGFRTRTALPSAYPGSPLIAASWLRPQDRAVLIEKSAEECQALAQALPGAARARVECGDGFAVLRAKLPPPERRALILIDPPYEESAADFQRTRGALGEILERFATAVVAVWYPIKDRRDNEPWLRQAGEMLPRGKLVSELWTHPCDSRIALNGSGLLIVNPPYRLAERMREWLPQLSQWLDPAQQGGTRIET